MPLRSWSRLAFAGVVLVVVAHACTRTAEEPADASFQSLHDRYVIGFLDRNPVVSTYLGGAALDPSLADTDGRLRDHSPEALSAEDADLQATLDSLQGIDPAGLTPVHRIDREVMLSQIRFLLHQHQTRRYQERALDTYTDEPFRGIDWQLQGMTQTGDSTYGTAVEWERVAERLEAIPAYFATAKRQLAAGVASGNTPDWRMIRRNGIETAEADAEYFAATLPALAEARIAGAERDSLLARVLAGADGASAAYLDLRDFVVETFYDDASAPDPAGLKPAFREDRYAMGEEEYDWALGNNLRLDATAAQLYEEAWPVVEATRQQLIDLAIQIGRTRGWDMPVDVEEATLAVFDSLSREYPSSDAQMIEWYTETGERLVDYGRRTGLFDVPDEYRLEVTQTPPPLRASIDGAAYYPAPPFKGTGVGRFYVTPTDDDPAALKGHNRAALADLAAHEGFPGHDWHYKVMTENKDMISLVRWLTPGAVEDSSSEWEDSMAAEGWGLYAEALMAESLPADSDGFYTDEERLYQLQGQLYRDLRVRIDTGIHTGRMGFDEAVDLFSRIVDFQPGSCADAARTDAKRASCDSSRRAIFRYSKWPTQAITYRLGKEQIYELRREAEERLGESFSLQAFHLAFMRQGTIPVGYFREELLRDLEASAEEAAAER
jgi:uncharacterized protein (DUF885 family)